MEQRLIDANALHDTILKDEKLDGKDVNWAVNRIISHILNTPTIDTTFREVVAYECGQKSVEERPTSEWIPVSERLPEDDEDVLVTHVGNTGLSFIDITYFDELDGKFFSQDGRFEISNVVAWMPLPKPYKEGGETNEREER